MRKCCIMENKLSDGNAATTFSGNGTFYLNNCTCDNDESAIVEKETLSCFINALFLSEKGSCSASLDYIEGMILTCVIVLETQQTTYQTTDLHLYIFHRWAFL